MKKSKIIAALVAASICGSTLMGGTMAWQSISQQATNVVKGTVNPGGRLHDDFDGSNKDVYVENFGDMPIYARIQFKEYFEIGLDAGDFYEAPRNVEIITRREGLDNPADWEDKDTWPIHRFYDSGTDLNDTAAWWQWTMGGLTQYMPTFNMNKDSVMPDINGTVEGKDGQPYDDFVKWRIGESQTDFERHDADTDDIDEYATGDGQEGVNYLLVEATHTVRSTDKAMLISMDGWNALSAEQKQDAYWVYDSDGWCYYSQPIAPQTASGLLLSGIKQLNTDHSFYYAIHVISQFVTADDVGTADKQDGFYSEGGPPSTAALSLLREIGAITEASEGYYNLPPLTVQPSQPETPPEEAAEAEAISVEADAAPLSEGAAPEQEPITVE